MGVNFQATRASYKKDAHILIVTLHFATSVVMQQTSPLFTTKIDKQLISDRLKHS